MSLKTIFMLNRNILNVHYRNTFKNASVLKTISTNSKVFIPRKAPSSSEKIEASLPRNISERYKVFDDKDAVIIENTSEELLSNQLEEEHYDEFEGFNLQRGINGVFEIDELVEILKQENVKDIFVSVVPSHIQFSEYICIGTGHSLKHNVAIAEFLRKLFKKKMHHSDPLPKIEGISNRDWICLDLGNIVLHIFQEETRQLYDLEMLWSVGPAHDDQCREYEKTAEMTSSRMKYLEDLVPADEK